MKTLFFLVLVLAPALAFGATGRSLESELKQLEVKDAVPSSKLVERIYAVQGRITPLKFRPEVGVSLAENFGGSGFLDSSQWSAEGRFHFSDRFALAASYSYVNNEFNGSAKNLQEKSGILPDIDYVKSRWEGRLIYNMFYGKFRFTRSQSLSFDQYIGLGAAQNELRSGTTTGPVGELGFAFWFGQHVSIRLGMKDYYYKENRTLSQGYAHNVHGYLQTGYIF
jgi:outer membrane beta-barrel protein